MKPVSSVTVWCNEHADELVCDSWRDASHRNSLHTGWDMSVPEHLYTDFLVQYADDVSKRLPQHFNEVVTPVAPFFVELKWQLEGIIEKKWREEEWYDSDDETDDGRADAFRLSTAAVDEVAQVLSSIQSSTPVVESVAGELSDVDEALQARSALPQTAAAVFMYRPYPADSYDVDHKYEYSVRIVWPNVLVDASTSRKLRMSVVAGLNLADNKLLESEERHDWNNSVGLTMYNEYPKVRMPHSHEVQTCTSCSPDEYALVEQLRQQLAAELGLAVTADKNEIRAEWIKRRDQWLELPFLSKSVAEYKGQLEKLRQCGCAGLGKRTDYDRCIELVGVIDAGGKHLADVERMAQEKPLFEVCLGSVRRPADTPTSTISFRRGAEDAALVKVKRRKLNSDGTYGEYETQILR